MLLVNKKLICRRVDIPADGMKECEVEGGQKVLVINAGDNYFAFQAVCPHQEVPLCEGLFDGETLTCHQHLWQWNIRTGEPMGLAELPLQKFEVAVEGDAIYLAE